MKKVLFLALALVLAASVLLGAVTSAGAADERDLKAAEAYYAEHSYALAAEAYAPYLDEAATDATARSIRFKWADSILRGKDPVQGEKAVKTLQALTEGAEHDQWWAESGVTLAEHFIATDPYSKMQEIKTLLDTARDYWAGSDDVETARQRFITISFQLADFVTQHWGWSYTDIRPVRLGADPSILPPHESASSLRILFEEVLKVAKTDEDKARAHYGIAMAAMQSYGSDPKQVAEVQSRFQTVVKEYPRSSWADDASYQLGQYAEMQGDYVAAVAAYRDLLARYRAGESPWLDDAQSQLNDITKPSLSLGVDGAFVSGSEARFGVNWRNLARAEATLYRLDMVQSLQMFQTGELDASGQARREGVSSYQEMLHALMETGGGYRSLPVQQRWTLTLSDDGKHVPQNAYKGLAEWRVETKDGAVDPKQGVLPDGAYLLVLSAEGVKPVYDLVLVTDLALVSKVAEKTGIVVAMDAKTGKPRAGASIRYLYTWVDANGNEQWSEGSGTSDENGLLSVALTSNAAQTYVQHNFFATAVAGDSQAFVQNSYYQYGNNRGKWWLYAFSDRPAYRPGETVSFKGILRQRDGGQFANTAGQQVRARIYDARGNQVKESTYTLTAYGAFDDTLVLDGKAALGEYRVDLYTADLSTQLASTTLFRLEEYKLPEYQVSIAPKPKASDAKSGVQGYRLGDSVEIEVAASYYFGGPVAKAQVEYLVYQQPYSFFYQPVRPFAWYYQDMMPQPGYYGGNTLVTQKTITTDAEGKAHFTIETPKDSASDLQYQVEVRVVDQSRREIRATQFIKVTRNAFFATLEPKQSLYRPGDQASVVIRTLTPNDVPVAVEGRVRVARNWWREPVPMKDGVLQPGGYDSTEVLTKFVKTDARGEAVFTFEPSEDGYYVVEFTGYDNGNPVKAETHVFVCKNSSVNIGYQYSGLQIITETDTYQVGDTLRAMVVSDRPESWVLLSQEADDLFGAKMLHLEGSVKLIEIPVTAQHAPNMFLTAVSGDHYQLKMASTQVIVPPTKQFLTVTVTSDKAEYQPQEKGEFSIKVTDQSGKPVQAEVALGLTDAAVYGIQEEMAPDIRQYFYGDKRPMSVQTQASFYQRPYLTLVRGADNVLMTEDEAERQKAGGGAVPVPGEVTMQDSLMKEKGSVVGMKAQNEMRALGAADGAMVAESSMAVPASPVPSRGKMEAKKVASMEMDRKSDKDAAGAGPGGGAEPVRSNFRSTVIWQPSVVTDAEGKARLSVTYPDSLTTWRLTARANTPETAVGTVIHEVRSNKDLMVRLQAPRFFTERDLTAVSALIDNMTDHDLTVTPRLTAKGLVVSGLYRDGAFVKGETGPVTVPAKGQTRVDWAVSAQEPGEAMLTVSARATTGTLTDSMQKTYPVIEHGIEKFIAKGLVLRGGADAGAEQTASLQIDLPKERIRETTRLRLTVSPSLAGNLLDALPYLADYPYGCVEQTMSRFLPAVIVAKTMQDLGISKQDAESYVRDVLEPRGDPAGHPQRRTEATVSRLRDMTREGLDRLYDFQHSDGGWGWWKEDGSDRFMSAYVVWGLAMARDAGVEVRSDVLDRGVRYLQTQLVEEENAPDMLAWMLHALAQAKSDSMFETKQRDRLWEMRDKLNPYTRALFALGEARRGDRARSEVLAQNLINGIDADEEAGTAHWGEAGVHYRWSDGGVESTAFVIKALSQIAPQSPQLDPAVKWLALNRRGASWKNTRDTAIAILGLTDYLKATRELAPDYAYEVVVNGVSVRKGTVTPETVFSFGRLIDLPAESLRDGANDVKVTFKGRGALYLAAHATYFTKEEGIGKAGNEVFITRQYFRKSTKETLMKGLTEAWAPLKDGDTVMSGDRIRVDMTLEAKNNYEYLLVEDYKPAGLEAVDLKSGAGFATMLDRQGRETQEQSFLYQEFRDQKAAFFLGQVKQGKHRLRYELRAEVPGTFHAMPNQTHAMYVPEIRANSDEMRLTVTEAAPKTKR